MIFRNILKPITIVSIVFFLFLSFPGHLHAEKPPEVSAEAALVMEVNTGKILWEKDSLKRLFPASTTKMLTAIIAIENISNFNQIIEISPHAAGRNHSFFSFDQGDRVSLMDLLKAALISSHNNATIALAEFIAGSEEEFVDMMNDKAKEIGAVNTYFQNTSGLDSFHPLHKTTAEDLAIIASYCLKDPIFTKIVSTPHDTIRINGEKVELKNTNRLLALNHIKGIKTGYTNNAGFCIVLYSDKGELELITVLLNSTPESREMDALVLNAYINDNFKYTHIIDKDNLAESIGVGNLNSITVGLYPESDFVELINISEDSVEVKYWIEEDVLLPIEKNQKLGNVDVYINDEMAAEIPLINRESVSSPEIEQYLSASSEDPNRNMLFLLIGFYFLVFIFIMVKNLFFRKKIYV